jgi:putative serine/threonine protein kinase
MKLSRQNTSFSEEFVIDSPALAALICYPRFSERDYAERLGEMRSLGIRTLFAGRGSSIVNGFSICGKGCVGLVFRAKMAGELVALKIRRTDADRGSMETEEKLLQLANSAGAGPRYLGHTRNLVAMQFVDGQSIIEWIATAQREQFRDVAKSILDQCYSLDQAGLDHGELSRLGRHVIVSGSGPCIVDFESASTVRKTINVSSAAQAVFLHGAVAGQAKKITAPVEREEVIGAIRNYKRLRTKKSYDELVRCLGI